VREAAIAAVSAMVIEGYKGPQVDRLAREAAEANYRMCTELFPYPVSPGIPRNCRIISQTETDRYGRERETQMCYPYGPSTRSVLRTWSFENISELKVAFLGGRPEMRRRIKEIADDWASVALDPNDPRVGLRFNFGRMEEGTSKFNEWSPSDVRFATNIRIAFEPYHGYWSMIGNQSDDPDIMQPGEPSMNLEGIANKSDLPLGWKRTVYHEFGHVLVLRREHQHPKSVCGDALRLEDEDGYEPPEYEGYVAINDQDGNRPGVLKMLPHAPWG